VILRALVFVWIILAAGGCRSGCPLVPVNWQVGPMAGSLHRPAFSIGDALIVLAALIAGLSISATVLIVGPLLVTWRYRTFGKRVIKRREPRDAK